MPFRMLLDSHAVAAEDAALVGARNLDPGEVDLLAARGIDDDLGRALEHVERVYVALDLDVLRAGEASAFMPEPGGPSVAEAEAVLRRVAALAPLAGVGFTGMRPEPANEAVVTRLAAAVGLSPMAGRGGSKIPE
jgi:arginase family enzyme